MILYKYCSAASALRILEDLRLKVALPNQCNDLFEFTPRSKVLLTRSYMLQKLRDDPEHFRGTYEMMVASGFSRPFQEFLQALPHQINARFPEVLRLYKAELVQNDLASRDQASAVTGILSLSEKNDSIPMWAHYAHNHAGAVIGVHAGDTAFRGGISGKVRYRKHRVAVDPAALAGTRLWWKQIHQTIFAKSREWSYEKEHRIVFRLDDLAPGKLYDGKPGHFVHIWGGTIHSVVLGGLISSEDEKAIRELVAFKKKTFGHMQLLRAVRHAKRFALSLEPA